MTAGDERRRCGFTSGNRVRLLGVMVIVSMIFACALPSLVPTLPATTP